MGKWLLCSSARCGSRQSSSVLRAESTCEMAQNLAHVIEWQSLQPCMLWQQAIFLRAACIFLDEEGVSHTCVNQSLRKSIFFGQVLEVRARSNLNMLCAESIPL